MAAPTKSHAGWGVRFAPSPTGRFHVGNLRTAWISEKWARALNQPWVVRFEDIDGPRVMAGARESQLADLAALGLRPDVVTLQSESYTLHAKLLVEAASERRVYPCLCTRREIAERLHASSASNDFSEASAPHAPSLEYDGRCRLRAIADFEGRTDLVSWRFRNSGDGTQDFIAARARVSLVDHGLVPTDIAPAYNWACAIDDAVGGYSLIVRASDLAQVAAPQRTIGHWLKERGVAPPLAHIYHTALVTQDNGHRLEKRTLGVTLEELGVIGFSAAKLLDLFEASYAKKFERDLVQFHSAGSEMIFGERCQSLSLADLGIRLDLLGA